MYDKNSNADGVDDARFKLFARKQRSYDAIQPTRASLVEHVKRATYQASCVWSQATACQMNTESPANWGWKQKDDIWQIVWMTLSPIDQMQVQD